MEKISSTSLDINKQNIDKIKKLFPEAVEEGKINFDILRAMLGDEVDDSREKYQFTWNGKAKSIKLAQTPSSATLRPCKEKSKNWDTTENLYIEGDNLEVLKQLQKTYYGKIKMIYIDPPYNTGNDFVYHDDFKDSLESYKMQTNQEQASNPETNGRYHSSWCSMIYPRLMLAKNLLTETGAIFVSVDDNEVCNLKKMMDELFGEENFVSQLTIIVKPEGRRYGSFAKTHEYVLVFSKDNINLMLNEIQVEGSKYRYKDRFGGFNLKGLRNRNVQAFNSKNRPNLRYPFYVDINNPDENGMFSVTTIKTENFLRVDASVINDLESVWRWGKEKALKQKEDLVGYQGNDGEIRIYQKERKLTQTPKTVWSNKEIISNKGTKEVQQMLGKSVFNFPKPIELLKNIISIGMNEDGYILDFFSGSATTAHAVMKLNAEDGGNRKFIMVQLPELCNEKSEAYKAGYKNICEIGEERIRRAGEQIKSEWEKAHPSDGLYTSEEKFDVDIGFKVFKLDSTNIIPWDNSAKYTEENLFNMTDIFKDNRSKEDILYEIMLKYGLFDRQAEEIHINGKTMYRVGKRYMIICLEDNITSEDVKAISRLSPNTVIFKESGFENDNEKINATYNLKWAGVEDIKCI